MARSMQLGHCICDPKKDCPCDIFREKEIKAGFAVTGLIHPEKIVTHAGARPGDRLILTKPIGMGIIAFAAQIGRAPEGAAAAIIGQMAGPGTGKVLVQTDGSRKMPAARPRPAPVTEPAASSVSPPCCVPEETNNMSCCEEHDASGGQAAASDGRGLSETKRKFQEFMKAANAPGALDARTKRVIAIALSVLAKCEPCLKSHAAKAKKEGFSEEEIDEAAWMAIAFGGSPTMMFYNKIRKS